MDIPKGTQITLFVTGIIFCIVTTFTFLVSGAASAPFDPFGSDEASSTPTASVVVAPPQGPITVQGVMLCLPHKDTTGPQTDECAFGLKDDSGRYFALSDSDPNYLNIIGVPMSVRVEVEGMFGPQSGSKYQDVGIISVTKITALDAMGLPIQ